MIVKFSELARLRKSLRGKRIVFAGGTFDLFHNGHTEYFKDLKKYGKVVIIAISSDKRVRQRKGNKRPILSEDKRLIIIDAIRYIDYSLIAPRPEKNKPVPTMRIIKILHPHTFVSIDKRWIPFQKEIKQFGTELKILQPIELILQLALLIRY